MAQRPPDPLYVLRGDMSAVSCLTFGPSEIIYAGTADGSVHIWDLKTNRERHSFKAGDSTCLSINILGESILTQVKGGLINIWSASGNKQQELSVPYLGFCRIVLFANVSHSFAFVPSENSVIEVVNLKTLKVLKSFQCSSSKLGEVMALKQSFLCNDLFLLVGYESGHVFLWDVDQGKYISEFKVGATPMAIDFDSEKRMGICGSESENVFVFRLSESNNMELLKSITITNPGVSSICIREDRKLFVLGCWDGNIRVFSWKSLRLLAVLSAHTESVHDLCFSPCAIPSWKSTHLLAAASKDKSISLWSVYET